MNRNLKFSLGILYLFLNQIANIAFGQAPDDIKIYANKKHTFITYEMSHPLHDWDGTSKNVNAVILYDKTTKHLDGAAVSVPVSTFDSKNANRDSHMMEVVEGIKYPNIVFASTSITQVGDSISVSGNLTFHGVSKAITFMAMDENKDKMIVVTGKFTVNMTDFEVQRPSLLGMETKDAIHLKFLAEFQTE